MTAPCTSRLSWETLVDYWAGDLEAAQLDTIDAHLMGCAECSADSARIAAITEAVRGMLPVLLTTDMLAKLRAKGVRVLENPMTPGERQDFVFPAAVDVVIHRLGGLELTHATTVRFTLHAESSGQLLAKVDDAPFDREAGVVLLACQQHFASFPPDTVAEVHTRDASGAERMQRYTILHHFARRP